MHLVVTVSAYVLSEVGKLGVHIPSLRAMFVLLTLDEAQAVIDLKCFLGRYGCGYQCCKLRGMNGNVRRC